MAGLLALCTVSCKEPGGLPELIPGQSLDGELAPGEARAYALVLAAGQFVHLVVDQMGVDVETTLFDPDGEAVITVDRNIDYQGREPLLATAEKAGTYTLEVSAFELEGLPRGTYRIDLLKPPEASETALLMAQGAAFVSRGRKLLSERKTKESVAELEEALWRWREVRDSFWQAETLYWLAKAYRNLGRPEKAVELYGQSAKISEEAGDLRMQAMALSLAGSIQYNSDKVEDAVSLHEQALELRQKAGDRLGTAKTCNNLGQVHRSQGSFQEALSYYGQALELWDEERDGERRAQTLHDLGVLYRVLGKTDRAASQLEKAQSEWSDLGNDRLRAASLNQLGRLSFQLQEWATALDYYRQALGLRLKTKSVSGQANTLVNIGLVYQALGRPAQALKANLNALTILQRLRRPRPRDQAKVRLALGSLYAVGDQQGEALSQLQEAHRLYREIGDPAAEAESLLGLAAAHSSLGNSVAARKAAEEAVNLLEQVRLSAASPELRSSFFSTVQHFFEFFIDLLIRGGDDARALETSEQARSRSLLEMLAETSTDLRRGAAPELLVRESELQHKLSDTAEQRRRLLDLGVSSVRLEELETELRDTAADLDAVRSDIRTRSPHYAALTQPRPLSLEEIQRQVLDEETLLLEYQLGEMRSFLWLASSDSLTTYPLPRREVIEEWTQEARKLLRHSHREESRIRVQGFLDELSRTLLGPVADRLADKRLVIVADGALQLLPFAALPDPRTLGEGSAAVPLIVRHEIAYLPSASVLAVIRRETATRSPASRWVSVLADPVFSSDDERMRKLGDGAQRRGMSELSRLKSSREEADAILSFVPAARSFRAFGFDASKDAVLRGDLTPARIVHFSTHGTIASQNEPPNLVFSRFDETGGEQEDNVLYAHELYSLDLAAELVVLSACDTALGKEVRGEGLIGLTRGFMYAGAPRVLVSLWSVGDRSTSRLMAEFYSRLLEQRLGPAAALRQAQIAMWDAGLAPAYWAPFVLQGEWLPLPPPEQVNNIGPIGSSYLERGASMTNDEGSIVSSMTRFIIWTPGLANPPGSNAKEEHHER